MGFGVRIHVRFLGPLTFGVAWLLFQAVQCGAGMVGPLCVGLTLILTALVLASNHVVFTLHGVCSSHGLYPFWVFPMGFVEELVAKSKGLMVGWTWLHPYPLLMLNVPPLFIGGGICAVVCGRR